MINNVLKNTDCFPRVTPRNKLKATCTKNKNKYIYMWWKICLYFRKANSRTGHVPLWIDRGRPKPCWMAGRANYFASEASLKYKKESQWHCFAWLFCVKMMTWIATLCSFRKFSQKSSIWYIFKNHLPIWLRIPKQF